MSDIYNPTVVKITSTGGSIIVTPITGIGIVNIETAGGGGTVTTTGTPASGNLTKFSGPTSITNGDLSGDVTTSGTLATTLATVNANTGSFGSSTAIPNFTVNGKGLITAAGTNVVIAPAGTLTGTTLASNVVTSSLTTVGTIGTGVWQGTIVGPTYGGTGINNGSSTITLGGNLATSGAFASTFTMTGTTSVTFPTSGTLATTANANVASVSNSDGTLTISPTTGAVVASIALGHANTWTGIQTMGTNTAIYLRNSGQSISSSASNTLDITATTTMNIASTITTLNIANSSATTCNIATASTTTNVGQVGDIKLGSATNKVGFYGNPGAILDTGWSVSNVTPTRTFDASSVTLNTLANIVGTLINTPLKGTNLISA